jgi:hypothetical protein
MPLLSMEKVPTPSGTCPQGMCTEVHGLASNLQAQHRCVDAVGQIEPGGCMGIQTLAQGGRPGQGPQAQGTGEAIALVLAFDGIEVVLAHTEKAQAALQNVAVGDAAAHRDDGINERAEVDALEILSNACQPSLVAQVVGQLFENQIGHAGFTCWVKPKWGLSG